MNGGAEQNKQRRRERRVIRKGKGKAAREA